HVRRAARSGAGSRATALAVRLARGGHQVRLWDVDAAHLEEIARTGENRKFLSGIGIPDGVRVEPELEAAISGVDGTVFAVPSHGLRAAATQVARSGSPGIPVCATKGLELATQERPTRILAAALNDPDPARRVGPRHAEEVSRGVPTAVVAACGAEGRATGGRQCVAGPRLRVDADGDV